MKKLKPVSIAAVRADVDRGYKHFSPSQVIALLDHIAALEAEAAQARDRALEEAAVACETAAVPITMKEWNGTRHNLTRATADSLAVLIRALKSKPARQAPPREPVLADYCPEAHPSERASEENGLLPKKRRREHEYGEEKQGAFGHRVASCVREGCRAFRLRSRNGKKVAFRQRPEDPATADPGPCEVES